MRATAWNNRHGVELKKCKNCSFVFSADSVYENEKKGSKYNNQKKKRLE